ncbi:hypothetical protein U9M48_040317 [Paspalum notatum var. saurae]|uniref:Uncharacterized protein n=1 Tax=Paspalum notatum var. saurae TaxID=547442 RepID=A0AAQ3ULH3_PASNO
MGRSHGKVACAAPRQGTGGRLHLAAPSARRFAGAEPCWPLVLPARPCRRAVAVSRAARLRLPRGMPPPSPWRQRAYPTARGIGDRRPRPPARPLPAPTRRPAGPSVPTDQPVQSRSRLPPSPVPDAVHGAERRRPICDFPALLPGLRPRRPDASSPGHVATRVPKVPPQQLFVSTPIPAATRLLRRLRRFRRLRRAPPPCYTSTLAPFPVAGLLPAGAPSSRFPFGPRSPHGIRRPLPSPQARRARTLPLPGGPAFCALPTLAVMCPVHPHSSPAPAVFPSYSLGGTFDPPVGILRSQESSSREDLQIHRREYLSATFILHKVLRNVLRILRNPTIVDSLILRM